VEGKDLKHKIGDRIIGPIALLVFFYTLAKKLDMHIIKNSLV
jgi:hypothetical protein